MKSFLTTSFSLASFVFFFDQSFSQVINKIHFHQFSIIENLQHPESVLFTQSKLYVTQMGPNSSSDKNGDGRLVRYNIDGTIDSLFKLKTVLHSPMGMASWRNIIFTADIDRVVGICKKNGSEKRVYDFTFTGTKFLNDLQIIDNNYLLVSATDIKKVYIINLLNNKIMELRVDLSKAAPNGIDYDPINKLLFFASNKEHKLGQEGNGIISIHKIDKKLLPGVIKIEEFSVGKFIDGIRLSYIDHKLLVSDWYGFDEVGRAYLFNLNKNNKLKLEQTLEMRTSGFADFDWSPFVYNQFLLASPDFIAGKVRIYKTHFYE